MKRATETAVHWTIATIIAVVVAVVAIVIGQLAALVIHDRDITAIEQRLSECAR